jgi:hypothetical protein
MQDAPGPQNMTTHKRANAGGDFDVDAFRCVRHEGGGKEVRGYVRDELRGHGLRVTPSL